MRFRMVDMAWSERPVAMRLPFQFGSTEVRETAEAYVIIIIEVDGIRQIGHSAQLMVPRWFDKRAKLSNTDTIDELRSTVQSTLAQVPSRVGTALSLSRELRADVAESLTDTPGLAAGFGPSLVEMAMIDALCRAKGVPFWRAAQGDLFGLVDGAPADLPADAITYSLEGIRPPDRITLRHTIGFDAPLWSHEVGADAPQDGQPVALDEVIARTGIRAFKIKLKGDPDTDLDRLGNVAKVVAALPRFSVTLDANEQYTPELFSTFLLRFREDPVCARVYQSTRFVEQPYPREIALSKTVSADLPLIIDESDSVEDAFPQAHALGWSGTSIKSCKGVLRALLNKARADALGAILSGEDLTCQPGLCWQQDTAMMAACGVQDVERNGHHFAGGMQGASGKERQRFLDAHPDIYVADKDKIGLRIDDGQVKIASLNIPGFAGVPPDALSLTGQNRTLY